MMNFPDIPMILQQWANDLGFFAFLIGLLAPMLEAFFPPLPLAAIATFNVMTFGTAKGFIFTAIGTVSGSFLLFLILSRFQGSKLFKKFYRHEKSVRLIRKIHDKGFWPMVIAMSFPFTPSCAVSFVAAVANMEKWTYLKALLIGKTLMTAILCFLGYQVSQLYENPKIAAVLIFVIVGLLFVGNKIFHHFQKEAHLDD